MNGSNRSKSSSSSVKGEIIIVPVCGDWVIDVVQSARSVSSAHPREDLRF